MRILRFLPALVLALPLSLHAQFVERPARTLLGGVPSAPPPEYLQNATVDFSGSNPRGRIKAVKYYAEVFQHYLPFYLFTGLDLARPDAPTAAKDVANEVLNQFGGTVNAQFGTEFRIEPSAVTDVRGLYGNWRVGAKAAQIAEAAGRQQWVPSGQAALNLFWLIPLTDSAKAGATQQGLITLSGGAMASYINADAYRAALPAGSAYTSVPLSANAQVSVHLFDQFYVSAGRSWALRVKLPDRTFVGLSFTRH